MWLRGDVQWSYFLPAEIGKLKRLEKLSIANSPIESFGGADFSGLENLTDLEIYNCPNIKEFPDLSTLPKLTTLNLSYIVSDNPESIKEDDVRDAIDKMSTGAASRSLQMFYCNNNGLTVFPKALGDFADLAMVDFSANEIASLPDMEGKFDPSELYLQNNKIESIRKRTQFLRCRYPLPLFHLPTTGSTMSRTFSVRLQGYR